jgi:signal peptidase II
VLGRVADGGRRRDEQRLAAVEARDALQPPHDVGEVRAEHAAVHVELVHHHEAQVGEEARPVGVVRQDAGVQHVRVGDEHTRALPRRPPRVAGGVSVVGDGALPDARVAQQPTQAVFLVTRQRLGGEQVERQGDAHARPDGQALADGGEPGAAGRVGIGEPPSLRLLILVAGLSTIADLASKGWAHRTLAGWDSVRRQQKRIDVIPDLLSFVFAQNPGGAWSFLRSWPDQVRRPFFLFVASAAVVFIVTIYLRLRPGQRLLAWGLAFSLGGALGNLVDRVRYGWVIDFIAVYVKRGGRELHWPTFNVADIAIVVGVLLMAIDMFRNPSQLGEGSRGDAGPRPDGGAA